MNANTLIIFNTLIISKGLLLQEAACSFLCVASSRVPSAVLSKLLCTYTIGTKLLHIYLNKYTKAHYTPKGYLPFLGDNIGNGSKWIDIIRLNSPTGIEFLLPTTLPKPIQTLASGGIAADF